MTSTSTSSTTRRSSARPAERGLRWAGALAGATGVLAVPMAELRPSALEAKTSPTQPNRLALAADPARLIGLDPRKLAALLGRPTLVRRDPPAQIWQFHDRYCILDVFLYDRRSGLEVTYVEARQPRSTAAANSRECLRLKLQASNRG
jgi:hypothetical protein